MKTVFDCNVSFMELEKLGISYSDLDTYILNTCKYKKLHDLYNLHKIRSDENKADELWEKEIKNHFILRPLLYY